MERGAHGGGGGRGGGGGGDGLDRLLDRVYRCGHTQGVTRWGDAGEIGAGGAGKGRGVRAEGQVRASGIGHPASEEHAPAGDAPDRGNRRVVMTCAGFEDTEPTADPSDRAHGVMAPGPGRELMLVPGAGVPGAKPRRYPACDMQGPPGRRVGIDSVYEQTDQRRARLAAEGLYGRADEPCGYSATAAAIERAMDRVESCHGRASVRGLTRGGWEK
jgi:hypothetical protein